MGVREGGSEAVPAVLEPPLHGRREDRARESEREREREREEGRSCVAFRTKMEHTCFLATYPTSLRVRTAQTARTDSLTIVHLRMT